MRFLAGIIFHIFANLVALWLAISFVPGFLFSGTALDLLMAAFILTIINYLLKPILKLILGPLIVLSLGLLTIVVNMATLYFLDVFSEAIKIEGLGPLFWGTIIVSVVNFIIISSAKSFSHHS